MNDNLNTHLIENGEVAPDPSVVFNKFFAQPRIDKQVLQLSVEDFSDHHSITAIKNKHYDLDFDFQEINAEIIGGHIMKLDTKKTTGPDSFSPK